MKHRILLSLLLTFALIYFALPLLSTSGNSLSSWFSVLWLSFAFIALGGNLAHLLYSPAKNKHKELKRNRQIKQHISKRRSYSR
jgi:hypothetical protein